MRTHTLHHLRRALIGATFFLAASVNVHAHDTSAPPASGNGSGSPSALSGTIGELVVEDRLANKTTHYPLLRLADGTTVLLRGAIVASLPIGAAVELAGEPSGGGMEVAQAQIVRPPSGAAAKAAPSDLNGRFAVAHFDDFASGIGGYLYELHADSGAVTRLNMNFLPAGLRGGMSVVVSGRVSADGWGFDPAQITIVGPPPGEGPGGKAMLKSSTVNKTLVIQANFTLNTPPANFNATAQQVMVSNTTSVSAYYNEVSYGQQTLNVAINADWVTMAAYPQPAVCIDQDLSNFTTAAQAASKAAGQDPANYDYIVHLFPSYGKCGWSGLAYIGWPHWAYINGTGSFVTLVVAHEMGHNFGLLHAGSLRCTGAPIGCGSAGTVAEYGDPFSTMGNIHAGHFNSDQKSILGFFPAGGVKTHGSGTATYTLSPIETAGQSVYAVTIPTSMSTRTYWIEYRQPVGLFDNFAFTNNGAQIRISSPFEKTTGGDDTEILDMTPGTTSYTDATLTQALSPFTDSTTGVSISVLSVTPGANGSVTVQVSTPAGAPTTTTLTSSLNPSIVEQSVKFTATVTGNAPTGTVDFTDGGSAIAGCSGLTISGSGNSRTAQCTTTSLVSGTHSIVASYSGDPTNAPSASSALSQVVNIVTGAARRKLDFDGDGHSDVLWANSSGVYNQWLMNGTAHTTQSLGTNNYTAAAIGDVTGEGRASIVWYNGGAGQVIVWRMNGWIALGSYSFPVAAGWTIKGIGDVNGDGKADIVWQSTSGQVVAWLMTWDGSTMSYTLRDYGIVGAGWSIAGVGDLDGDGVDDIVWFYQPSGLVYTWLMNSAGVKAVSAIGMVAPGWTIQKVGDFDGDGKADLFWRNGSSNAIWYMNGASVASVFTPPSVASTWSIVGVGDYDGDGKYDLMWRDASGNVYQWKMGARGAAPTVNALGNQSTSWNSMGQ
jgi:hypothetical protein